MSRPARPRWYDDACGAAFALDLLGERWSILIIRELMFGGRRFNELRANLSGLSANVLTQRLESLEATRILQRRWLPPPVSAQIYELTAWGYEAEPIIQTLGRWATRHPDHDPQRPLSAAALMLSFRTMLDAERAAGLDAKIGFRLGAEGFVAHIRAAQISIARAEPEACDVLFEAEPTMIAAAVYGEKATSALEAAGRLVVQGNRRLAKRFLTLFPLPEKLARPG